MVVLGSCMEHASPCMVDIQALKAVRVNGFTNFMIERILAHYALIGEIWQSILDLP